MFSTTSSQNYNEKFEKIETNLGFFGGEEEKESGLKMLTKEHIKFGLMGIEKSPFEFINELKKQRGLKDETFTPVVTLLELLGARNSHIMKRLLEEILAHLMEIIPTQTSDSLNKLLEKCLPYVSIRPLQQIPFKIMEILHDPNDAVIDILSAFNDQMVAVLPERYKQLVWENNLERFDQHISPFIDLYTANYKATTINTEMNIQQSTLPKDRRGKNVFLKSLKEAIGKSGYLYYRAVRLIRQKFLETSDTNLCCLRADLLMSFQESQTTNITSLDYCHQLAWYLDTLYKKCQIQLHQGSLPVSEVSSGINNIYIELLKVAEAVQHFQQEEPEVLVQPPQPEVNFNSVMIEAVEKLMREDRHGFFTRPVTEMYPELSKAYLSMIEKPMDLKTIRKKIENNMYYDLQQITADFALIYDNCVKFNTVQSPYTKIADKLINKRAPHYLNAAAEKLKQALVKQALHQSQNLPVSTSPIENLKKTSKSLRLKKQIESLKTRKMRKIALSDACMLLHSAFSTNALGAIFFVILAENSIRQRILPRKDDLLKKTLYLLQAGATAPELVNLSEEKLEHSLPTFQASWIEGAVPVLALFQSQGIEFRAPDVFVNGFARESEVNMKTTSIERRLTEGSKFWATCEENPTLLHLFLLFLVIRVRSRDKFVVEALFAFISQGESLSKKLVSKIFQTNGFLHSLTTAFYFNFHKQNKNSLLGNTVMNDYLSNYVALPADGNVGNSKGNKFVPQSHDRSIPLVLNKLPPITSEDVDFAIRFFYLPAIYQAMNKFIKSNEREMSTVASVLDLMCNHVADQTVAPSKKAFFIEKLSKDVCLSHDHFGRLISLTHVHSAISPHRVHLYSKIAMMSLIGIHLPSASDTFPNFKENSFIKEIEPKSLPVWQQNLLCNRFFSPQFKRARDFHEKNFALFPMLRSSCGLPNITGDHEGYNHSGLLRRRATTGSKVISPSPRLPTTSPTTPVTNATPLTQLSQTSVSPWPTPFSSFGTPRSGGSGSQLSNLTPMTTVTYESDTDSDVEMEEEEAKPEFHDVALNLKRKAADANDVDGVFKKTFTERFTAVPKPNFQV